MGERRVLKVESCGPSHGPSHHGAQGGLGLR